MPFPDVLLETLSEFTDIPAFLKAHSQPSPVSIRKNCHKNGILPEGEAVVWCEEGRYLPERPVFTLDPAFHAGAYYVQEASSMFVAWAWEQLQLPKENLRVLDLCAAPGGKSTLLLDKLKDTDLLIANEVIKSRSRVLADNLSRWGRPNVFVTNNDPANFEDISGYFDVILVDAPCSGSGMFRKNPDTLNEWSEANVAHCAVRQERILTEIWPSLKQGGYLIYATCSFSSEENEDILDTLTDLAESVRLPLPAGAGILETQSVDGHWGYRFLPDKVRGEGFFLAVLRKENREMPFRISFRYPKKASKTKLFKPWVKDFDGYEVVEKNEDFFLLKPQHIPDFELFSRNFYLRKAGIRLGQIARQEIIPDHELALSLAISEDTPRLALSQEEALLFLKREAFDYPNVAVGWYLVTYQGLGLGWAKVLPGRVNNYLPKDWRILMDIL